MINFQQTNFKDQKVVMRVDFNVPLDAAYNVTDDTRIAGAAATIQKILNDGGSVVLMSHLGRPKGGPENKYSLRHILPVLQSYFEGVTIHFADDCISEDAFAKSAALKNGELLLLENLRFYPEEEKGNPEFAKKLTKHGTIYINDAFGTAHREHASTATIATNFDTNHKGFGYLMAAEVENATKLLNGSEKPVTAIVGGAKVSDKIQLLERLIDSMDNILIGGGMAYTFLFALGGKIGNSLFEAEFVDLAIKIMDKAKACWMQNGKRICSGAIVTCGSVTNISKLGPNEYTVTIYYDNGCFVTDVFPYVVTDLYITTFPEIINPGSGSGNNTFHITTSDPSLFVKKMRIYDRWGNLVFIAENFRRIGCSKLEWTFR